MDSVIVTSRRLGVVELPASALIDMPDGLPGVPGTRFAVIPGDGALHWLQSLDDPELALPLADPWSFFDDYRLVISDDEARRAGLKPGEQDVHVWAIVRAGGSAAAWTANLRAPLIMCGGRGRQVLNDAEWAPLRAELFPPAGDIAA